MDFTRKSGNPLSNTTDWSGTLKIVGFKIVLGIEATALRRFRRKRVDVLEHLKSYDVTGSQLISLTFGRTDGRQKQ